MAKKKSRIAGAIRYILSASILGGAIFLTVLMSMSRKKAETRDDVDLLQTVSVFKAESFQGKLEIDVFGMVEPHREVEIASQVSGVVEEKTESCRAGTYVRKDTLLLTIDSANYELTRQRLEAEKKQAEASIAELDEELAGLNSSLELARREYKLQKQETDRRLAAGSAMSKSELDQARRALNTAERTRTEIENSIRNAKARRNRLENGIELSEVRLKEAELDKARCQIRAPFDGVVVSDMVEQGDFVTSGKSVIMFEDTSMVDVKCNLRLEQLAQIVKYQTSDSRSRTDPMAAYQLPPTPVTIYREVDGDVTKWSGTLSRFDGIGVDAQTKMIPCRVEVANPVSLSDGQPRALVRGMFVNVNIELNAHDTGDEILLTFPAIAVQPGSFVWTVVDGKLDRHRIEVVDRKNASDPNPRNRMVVVRVADASLQAGSIVVTSPLAQPIPGTRVNLVEGPADASGPATLPGRSTSTSLESEAREADDSRPASSRVSKEQESTRS